VDALKDRLERHDQAMAPQGEIAGQQATAPPDITEVKVEPPSKGWMKRLIFGAF